MALFRFAGRRLVTKFRQLVIKGFDRLGALSQQIVDEGLLAVLDRLLFQKEFLDGVRWLFFPHR